MSTLILPDKVVIKFIGYETQAVPLNGIAVCVRTFARHKNDIQLGPYFSNRDGIVTITKKDLENEAKSTYVSGVMDYTIIESHFSLVELSLYTDEAIKRMIESRTNVWNTLLDGETERWSSIDELVKSLQSSNNHLLAIDDSLTRLRTEWDGQKEYKYEMTVYSK